MEWQKDSFVRPLAKQLMEVYKVNVWYDEFSLEFGDSLLESIEKGLQHSSFGIVIFSNSFFKKTWTDHEVKSLRTKEMLFNEKVIIPIWYNVSAVDVAKYSLTLADKFAISINNNFDIDDIAIKIIKIVREDIYNNISRMRYFEQLLANSKKIASDNILIPTPPIRHEKLSTTMKARLKLIHNTIKDIDGRSFEQYDEDFRRSTNIDREMIITELITAAYIDCIGIRDMTFEEKSYVYHFTLILANNNHNLPIDNDELSIFTEIINSYVQDIIADAVFVEYQFDN